MYVWVSQSEQRNMADDRRVIVVDFWLLKKKIVKALKHTIIVHRRSSKESTSFIYKMWDTRAHTLSLQTGIEIDKLKETKIMIHCCLWKHRGGTQSLTIWFQLSGSQTILIAFWLFTKWIDFCWRRRFFGSKAMSTHHPNFVDISSHLCQSDVNM